MNSTKRTRGTMHRVVRTLNEAEDASRQDKPGTTTNGIIAVPRVSLTPSVLFSSLESSNGAVLLPLSASPEKFSPFVPPRLASLHVLRVGCCSPV